MILYKSQYPYARTLLIEAAKSGPHRLKYISIGDGELHDGEEKPAQAALERAAGIEPDFLGIAEARQAFPFWRSIHEQVGQGAGTLERRWLSA